jgi:murein DD-endopeptidase MepM/ murein hydrolase activator NlpD
MVRYPPTRRIFGARLPRVAIAAALAVTTVVPSASDGGTWHWPLDPPWRITRSFEAPATRYSAGHRGVDIRAAPGDVVYAVADGLVHFSGMVAGRPVVTIELPDATLVSYEPVDADLAVGEHVARGGRLGVVGGGGHCDAACVHLGVRVDGDYVSPLRFLAEVPRAVLLPLR